MSVTITIHARHRRIGPELRAHIHDRLERILHHDRQGNSGSDGTQSDIRAHSGVQSIDVEITSERDTINGNQRVDLTMFSRGRTFRAEASAPDAWQAVDRAARRLQEQVRRDRQRRLARRLVGRRALSA